MTIGFRQVSVQSPLPHLGERVRERGNLTQIPAGGSEGILRQLRRLPLLLGLVLFASACVTIHIYFPAAAAEEAARTIVREVLELPEAGASNPSPSPETGTETDASSNTNSGTSTSASADLDGATGLKASVQPSFPVSSRPSFRQGLPESSGQGRQDLFAVNPATHGTGFTPLHGGNDERGQNLPFSYIREGDLESGGLSQASELLPPNQEFFGSEGTSRSVLVWILERWIPAAQAQTPNIRVQTPAVQRIQASMRTRNAELLPHWQSGAIGFSSDGLVLARDLSALPLRDRPTVQRLINEENADRVALYREIARANDRPDWEAQIRNTFARVWVEEAPRGYWFQNTAGQWQQK